MAARGKSWAAAGADAWPATPVAWEKRFGETAYALIASGKGHRGGAAGQAAPGRLVARPRAAGGIAMPVTVAVLDSPTINALTLPGGHVLIMRDLIGEATDRPMLAGVTALELGHVAGIAPVSGTRVKSVQMAYVVPLSDTIVQTPRAITLLHQSVWVPGTPTRKGSRPERPSGVSRAVLEMRPLSCCSFFVGSHSAVTFRATHQFAAFHGQSSGYLNTLPLTPHLDLAFVHWNSDQDDSQAGKLTPFKWLLRDSWLLFLC